MRHLQAELPLMGTLFWISGDVDDLAGHSCSASKAKNPPVLCGGSGGGVNPGFTPFSSDFGCQCVAFWFGVGLLPVQQKKDSVPGATICPCKSPGHCLTVTLFTPPFPSSRASLTAKIILDFYFFPTLSSLFNLNLSPLRHHINYCS